MDPSVGAVLEKLELFGDVGERTVTDFDRPVKFETSSGSMFLLLPSNASARAAWECGLTLFAIPCAGDPSKITMLDLLLYSAARTLRVASLATLGGVLRAELLLGRPV